MHHYLCNLPSNSLFFQNPPGTSDKVVAILPDSSGGSMSSKPRGGFSVGQVQNGGEGPHRRQQPFPGSTAHDAVLVLDPSPGENFGHPVVLFYVDVNVTKKRCSHLDGIYLGESADGDSIWLLNGYLVFGCIKKHVKIQYILTFNCIIAWIHVFSIVNPVTCLSSLGVMAAIKL